MNNNDEFAPAFSSEEAGGGKSSSRAFKAREADSGKRIEIAREDLLRRVPPQNIEAEQAVLSGILLRPDLLHEIVDEISEEDFYVPSHRIIFSVFLDLYRKGTPIDEVTVFDGLLSNGQLDKVGGAAYLAELSKAVVSGANAAHWAKIVKDKATLRSLIGTSAEIIANAYDTSHDVPQLLDDAERNIFAISERANSKTFASAKDLVATVFNTLTERFNNRHATTGVSTGYLMLDQMTAGLQRSDLIIIAARPSMGKTAFALNLSMRSALTAGNCVAIFSLEMSKESLMDRMLCAKGRVDLSKVRKGYINDEEWIRLQQAADELSRAKIFIDDTAGLTPLALRARCRRLKAEHGLDLVMVDYLQLMRSSRNESRELEISDISRNLKALAKEMQVPVIALSQLNRKVEERQDKTPMLSDLRESGAIEQDADLIMFIHREDAYKKKSDEPRTNIAEIIIGKHRNGPTGKVELAYRPQFTVFDDLESSYAEPSELKTLPSPLNALPPQQNALE